MGYRFQVWKFHFKISPWEEKPFFPLDYGPWDASFSFRGLIFEGEKISIPETRPIPKSYISNFSSIFYEYLWIELMLKRLVYLILKNLPKTHTKVMAMSNV